MCYTFTVSWNLLEKKFFCCAENKYLVIIETRSCFAYILERKFFFLPCFFQLFLYCVSAEAQGGGEEMECEREGLKPLRFFIWTVLECTFPVIKTFHPDLMTWLLLLACNFSLNTRIWNLKILIFWRTFSFHGVGGKLFSSGMFCSGFLKEDTCRDFPRKTEIKDLIGINSLQAGELLGHWRHRFKSPGVF